MVVLLEVVGDWAVVDIVNGAVTGVVLNPLPDNDEATLATWVIICDGVIGLLESFLTVVMICLRSELSAEVFVIVIEFEAVVLKFAFGVIVFKVLNALLAGAVCGNCCDNSL